MSVVNLAIRFACEIATLVAVIWWEWPIWGFVIAAWIALFWGAFIGPKSFRRAPDPYRFGMEMCVFAIGAFAFVEVGHPVIAAVFAVFAVESAVLTRVWPEPGM